MVGARSVVTSTLAVQRDDGQGVIVVVSGGEDMTDLVGRRVKVVAGLSETRIEVADGETDENPKDD